MLAAIVLLQAAAAQAAQTPPDIELGIDASVRRVTIERRGEASLEVRGGEGSIVEIEAPDANGRRTLRNVKVRVRAEARIADPASAGARVESSASADRDEADQNREAPETAQPQ